MFQLTNKIAVITGGGSGIGKAISILFALMGATVHIFELNSEASKEAVRQITYNEGRAFAQVCDVTNQREVLTAFNKVKHIDILVNNAGVAHVGKVETTSAEDFDRILNVNVRGVYNCLYAAGIHLDRSLSEP